MIAVILHITQWYSIGGGYVKLVVGWDIVTNKLNPRNPVDAQSHEEAFTLVTVDVRGLPVGARLVSLHRCAHSKKGKGSFYIAQYPVRWTAQSTLHFFAPSRPVHSNTNSASLGTILAMQQLRATTKSVTFPPLSIARYSFIQLSQLGRQWRERKCPIFETVTKGDSNTGSLDSTCHLTVTLRKSSNRSN